MFFEGVGGFPCFSKNVGGCRWIVFFALRSFGGLKVLFNKAGF